MKPYICFFIGILSVFESFSQNKPELFMLSVGVSKYQNPKYNLMYAHKDALDLAEAFKNQTNLFDVRKVSILIDEKATRANIRSELAALKKEITANDLFVFVFSGHGLNEALVTHDFNISDRTATSLQKSDLVELIAQFNCNYMVLIDACHSGSFAKSLDTGGKDIDADFIREQNIANEKLLRALNATDKANIVIGSSSSSEKSEECTVCQNGYFTQSILDALEGLSIADAQTKKTYSPDPDKNGFVYTDELDNYLKEAVSLKTKNNAINQSVISRQSPGFNFPVFKLLDSDQDGTADLYDECQGIKGSAMGCVDTDNDGIADKIDRCVTERGSKENFGCPSAEQAKKNEPIVITKIPKSATISKSIIFPGWGDKDIKPESKKSWLGSVGYATLVGGIWANSKSKNNYNQYLEAKTVATVNELRSKTQTFATVRTILFSISGVIWTYDIAKVAFSKNAKLQFRTSEIMLKFNVQ